MMPAPDPGSFRDPTNRVLIDGQRVFRGLDGSATEDFGSLAASALYQRALADGDIVATETLDGIPAELADQGWATVLEHERVPVISYAYEWSFGMLRDAALLELDLTLGALDDGLIMKDATPYNVQFIGAKPVHIDVGSFERLTPGEPWYGYRQFCEQFLNPLLLSDRRGITHQRAMRGSIRGISPQDCAASLRWRDLWRPSTFVHVTLQARADRRRRAPDPADGEVRNELRAAGFGTKVIVSQLQRLRKLIASLEWGATTSVWSEYSQRGHYEDEDLAEKARFVEGVAARRRPRQVLDLGANDGFFSTLVLPYADHVVAVDHDPLVIDRLYRKLKEAGEARVLPLVVDLADPPGGTGWRAHERAALTERLDPDLVLCLALIHHLSITESIPLEEVVAFLASFHADVVLEFPRLEDPMVQVLIAQKKDRTITAERYGQERLERALDVHFTTVQRTEIGTRVLYDLRAPDRTDAEQNAAHRVLTADEARRPVN